GRVREHFESGVSFRLPYLLTTKKNRFVGIDSVDVNVGRLVAHHFIRPLKEDDVVFRKNGISSDDHVNNLEIICNSELGRRTGRLSTSRAVVQLDAETLESIDEFRSIREAGRETYLSHEAVRMNILGRTRVAGGMYKFMYVEDYERMISSETKACNKTLEISS